MSDFPLQPYPWQSSDWQQLSQLAISHTLPHALMFAGPKGVGKRHLAETLAQRLLCTSPAEGLACGKCRGCELNNAQTHPDLFWLTPEEEGKGIKVDQVRELNESLSKTARQGGYKVVIIEPAEAMNANAANALLKSLEEPAQNTSIILVAHRPSAVIPTIRSRCQLRKMPLPPAEQVISWLKHFLEKVEGDKTESLNTESLNNEGGGANEPEQLLLAAGGAPLTAVSLLEGNKLEERAQLLNEWEKLTLRQASAIEIAASWHTGDVPSVLDWLINLLHAISRWKVGADSPQIEHGAPEFKAAVSHIHLAYLHRYIEKVLLLKRQLLSGANPNKQLLLEELLLDWCALLELGRNPTVTAGRL